MTQFAVSKNTLYHRYMFKLYILKLKSYFHTIQFSGQHVNQYWHRGTSVVNFRLTDTPEQSCSCPGATLSRQYLKFDVVLTAHTCRIYLLLVSCVYEWLQVRFGLVPTLNLYVKTHCDLLATRLYAFG